LVVQPDGKLVAAGDSSSFTNGNFEIDFALARYNPDGSLDRSFGGDGRVCPNFGVQSAATALVLQPDGKLVAAGSAAESFLITTPGAVPASDVLLARFNPNGSLDASFGAGGIVQTDFGRGEIATALVLQPDGKLVTVAVRLSGPSNNIVSDLILARHHPDGSLDASFGAGGFVVESGIFGSALVLQPDGKLVAAGGGAFRSGDQLFRFNPDGTLDTSFGDGGRVGPNFGGGSRFGALVLQPDGKLVAAGNDLARFNPDSSLDTSFGAGGVVRTGSDTAEALVLQPDGKLVAAGGRLSIQGSLLVFDLLLARYHPDGSLDASFGAGGLVMETRGGFGFGAALVLQPDGRLVAADGRQLFRFNPDGTLDTSFGDGGRVGPLGGPR
ncbi:MAG: delta-60 repeat domain-containing protein, partial [Gammaproteobacteria bacterium]